MKRLFLVLFVLCLMVGSASAESYMGMFVSPTNHDGPGDSRVTVAPNEPYTIYLMVNADWNGGFNSWSIKMTKNSNDYVGTTTINSEGPVALGTPFDYNGWSVTCPNSCWYGWNLVATIEMLYAGGGAHTIDIGPYNLTQVPKYLDCAGVELPLSIIGPFGVNVDVTPANDSSWGAVKSLYK